MGKCIATMPYRGRWISLASMAGPETTLDVNLLWRKNLRVIGSTLRSRTSEEKAQILDGLVRDVWPAFESRKFAPFVHKVLPIAEVEEAHRIMAAGENRGKIVLEVK
jgi:NADPH2:quinone reductase